MVTFILLAAGIGAGLWALVVWLFPPRPSLAALLSHLDNAPAPPPILRPAQAGWAARLGRPLVGVLRDFGLPNPGLGKDLAITGQTPEKYLAEKGALMVTGVVLPGALQFVLTVGERPAPWPIPLAGSIVLALAGFLLPDLTVRAEATRRRSSFRHALSAYLDLIDIFLAGGAGVDAALFDAAGAGHGWSFQQLRRALNTARATRTTVWTTLGQLGDEVDVTELSELAAALSLAGTEGAKVRASLSAKAEALRSKGGAEAEAKANSATERMTVPTVLLAFGFVLFVFYPAITQITASL